MIFEELIRANDTNPQYFRQLGNAQRHLSKFDEALESYKKAKELDPSSSKAYSDEGKLYYDIRKYNKAEEQYLEAISLNPQERYFGILMNIYRMGPDLNLRLGKMKDLAKLESCPNKVNTYISRIENHLNNRSVHSIKVLENGGDLIQDAESELKPVGQVDEHSYEG